MLLGPSNNVWIVNPQLHSNYYNLSVLEPLKDQQLQSSIMGIKHMPLCGPRPGNTQLRQPRFFNWKEFMQSRVFRLQWCVVGKCVFDFSCRSGSTICCWEERATAVSCRERGMFLSGFHTWFFSWRWEICKCVQQADGCVGASTNNFDICKDKKHQFQLSYIKPIIMLYFNCYCVECRIVVVEVFIFKFLVVEGNTSAPFLYQQNPVYCVQLQSSPPFRHFDCVWVYY